MTTSEPDDLPPETLAAFADGELAPRDRDRVEQWLADHPEARDLLDDQESLGPRNAEFWNAVRPPEPSHWQWAAVRDGIRGQAPAWANRRWRPWVASLALAAAATAATVVVVLPPPDRPVSADPVVTPRPADLDDEPFAMAGPDDVRILSLPESAAHLLVVGDHPLRDTLVVLARSDEVDFLGIGADLAGRFPDLPEAAPEDPPMLWAPKEP